MSRETGAEEDVGAGAILFRLAQTKKSRNDWNMISLRRLSGWWAEEWKMSEDGRGRGSLSLCATQGNQKKLSTKEREAVQPISIIEINGPSIRTHLDHLLTSAFLLLTSLGENKDGR